MEDSLIITQKFEKIFMLEARKSGLIKRIDVGIDTSEFDDWEEKLFSRYYKSRQRLFQMILLYDELIIPSADPIYDYSALNEKDKFSVYSFDDYLQYDPIHMDSHAEFAHYLKPALMPELIKTLKGYFVYEDSKMRLKEVISDLYESKRNSNLDTKINMTLVFCGGFFYFF